MNDPTWPEDATKDRLVGEWSFWQRKGGHRTSTDDLLTAWAAAQNAGPSVARYLDLGCGIGSVLLQTVSAVRPNEAVGIEAQEQSALMARRSIAELPEGTPPIEVRFGDLRDLEAAELGLFELITGSPPYLPEGTGIVSPDPQRAACRFELRGGIEAYCESAERFLTDAGQFFVVFQTQWDERVLAAGAAANLHLRWRADVRTRVDRPAPFLTVYGFQKQPGPCATVEFATRDSDGELTPEYRAVGTTLGHVWR
ncbi:MAG: tRNA1(Val) A37 N6-methylase TrmN6 [Bradymonadia bacterium]|jgi:tRNA1(Val) A37 N6-methylase TrmN6